MNNFKMETRENRERARERERERERQRQEKKEIGGYNTGVRE